MGTYSTFKYNLIYAYVIPDGKHEGYIKVGKASMPAQNSFQFYQPNCPELKHASYLRIDQETKTAMVDYELLYCEVATYMAKTKDGFEQPAHFEDHEVHDVLEASGYFPKKFEVTEKKSEWFPVNLDIVKKAIWAVKNGLKKLPDSQHLPLTQEYAFERGLTLRDEQKRCVEQTIATFEKQNAMLWACKMRFGKTVTAYELIRRQNYKKVIVITHRPAVEDGWGEDHKKMFPEGTNRFIDKTKGAYFFDDAIDAENDRMLWEAIKENTPFVYFASIQDLRGSKRIGGKYNKNNAVFDIDWDLLIIDEAHEGTTTDLGGAVIEAIRKEGTKVLSLSGTPYNIMDGFDENVFSWTYVDEQSAKAEWEEKFPNEKNPYEELPRMNIFTFDLSEKMPASYRYVTSDSAFNFHEFFRTWTGDIEHDFARMPSGARIGDFVHRDDVYQFLSLISKEDATSNYPFSTEENRDMFAHTFWIVPGVKEARALSEMIRNHPYFSGFEVVNIAGEGDEEKPYDEALDLVKSSIKAFKKTITISCGKLTTGVTVREWTGILMLSGSSSTSASGYMQAIFRVQSPYTDKEGRQKTNCYVFDFAPDRTLKVIAEVHRVTTKSKQGDEHAKIALGKFINFCPIIAVDGTKMEVYDVDNMMRQFKRISVEAAIDSGFDDDTIYLSDAGMNLSELDAKILHALSDVVAPQKKGNKQTKVVISDVGMTNEQRETAERVKNKPKKELSPEEKEALELYKAQKKEQKKMFDLLRAVSVRLPLLFYGADADITEVISLDRFTDLVDDESWEEFMPKGLKKELFKEILRFYDQDVVVGAGLRIRKMAKAADELAPTFRVRRIVEILSRFKNPDKETVLTPWRVVNMHMGGTIGGYNFFDEDYKEPLEEPRFADCGDVSADIFLNPNARVLEMNSKSGLYPLYLAYSFYMLNVPGLGIG